MKKIPKIFILTIFTLFFISFVNAACIDTACGTNSPAGGRTATGTKCCAFFCNGNIKEYYTWYPSQTWSRAMQPLSTTNCSSLGKQCITSQYTGSDYCGTASCTSECSPKGKIECYGSNAIRVCADPNKNGCLKWATANCQTGQRCNYTTNRCETTCIDECSPEGKTTCSGSFGIKICGDPDYDGCLEWTEYVPCPDQYPVCNSTTRQCEKAGPTCTNECTAGTTECTAEGKIQTCGQHDSDPCNEFGPPMPCASDKTCNPKTATCVGSCSVSVEAAFANTADFGKPKEIHFFSYLGLFRKKAKILTCKAAGGTSSQLDYIKLVSSSNPSQSVLVTEIPYVTPEEIFMVGQPFRCRVYRIDGTVCESEDIYVDMTEDTSCNRRIEVALLENLAVIGKSLKAQIGNMDIEIKTFSAKPLMSAESKMGYEITVPIRGLENKEAGVFSVVFLKFMTGGVMPHELENYAKELAKTIENGNIETASQLANIPSKFIVADVSYNATAKNIKVILKERRACPMHKQGCEKRPEPNNKPSILENLAAGPTLSNCAGLNIWKGNKHNFCEMSVTFSEKITPEQQAKLRAELAKDPSKYIATKEKLIEMENPGSEKARKLLEELFDKMEKNGIEIYFFPEEIWDTKYTGLGCADSLKGKIFLKDFALVTLPKEIGKFCVRTSAFNPGQVFVHEATHIEDSLDFLRAQLGEGYDPAKHSESEIRSLLWMPERVLGYYQFEAPYVRFTKPAKGAYTIIKIQRNAATEFNARSMTIYYKTLEEGTGYFPKDTPEARQLKATLKLIKKGYPYMDPTVEIISKPPH